ncbi:hypothetical protein [Methylobacterium planeticum]|uniref:Uncharacterized protein n=1 Tax=Methylobacterium planeticum TaxID=2615211 RepID=A0A6N6MWJ8_9HYPH|nr:hypothetical protein [Methylobacterium planeticum]KAB1074314.1 hypothetical protein F6X51_08020 [Methylobacterium planeticum]
MKYAVAALALAFLATPALAQGNAPYNSSGSQAGGPLAGQEREMGARGGTPSVDPATGRRSMAKPTRASRKAMKRRSNRM